MKIQVLSDLMTEINRLFIAGAKLSSNDPRLAKLVPTLEKMGERAPVFKRLADETSALLSSSAEESGERLLSLGTLLYSVLYTQGESSADGEYSPAQSPTEALNELYTDINYGRLYPLIEALKSQKTGRFEIVKTAFGDGLFRDLRTHAAAVYALEDKYAELADYIEETVIPSIGKAAIPQLIAQYDPCGGRADGRRLSLLGKLGCENAAQLALDALDGDGTNVAVSVAAIEILGRDEANEPLLLALTKDRKKDLREAALTALVYMDSADGKRTALEIFTGNGYKTALAAMSVSCDSSLKLIALEAARVIEGEVLKGGGDKKTVYERCERYIACAYTLPGLPLPEVTEYMVYVLTNEELRKASGVGIYALYRRYLEAIAVLPSAESDKLLKKLAGNRKLSDFYSYGVQLWFKRAAPTYSPREMYKEFAGHLKAGHIASDMFTNTYSEANMREQIDDRWFDDFLSSTDANNKLFAVTLSNPNDKHQMKKLRNALRDVLKDVTNTKVRRLPYYIPPLLNKLAESGTDFSKDLSPNEAKIIIEHCGGSLSQRVIDTLT